MMNCIAQKNMTRQGMMFLFAALSLCLFSSRSLAATLKIGDSSTAGELSFMSMVPVSMALLLPNQM
jgi:hypothetical protein